MRKINKGVFTLIAIVLITIVICGCVKTDTVYSLSFDVDGEIVHTISTNGKGAITLPQTPEKEGFIFDGWYWDIETFANEVREDTLLEAPITTDMTVYAKWIIDEDYVPTYTITFNSNGGSDVASITEEADTSITRPADPIKEGFVFGGWFTDDGTFAEEYVFADMPDASLTLYAKWTATSSSCNIVTATDFEVDGQTITLNVSNSVSTYNFTDKITTSGNSDWVVTRDSDGNIPVTSKSVTLSEGENTFYIIVTAEDGINTNLYIVKINKAFPEYTVTLNVDGGESLVSNTVKVGFGSNYQLPVPEKANYDFLGWYDSSDNPYTDEEGKSFGAWDIRTGKTLTAHWRRIATEQEATAAILALEDYASRWVINNSTDTYNRSTALRNALMPRAIINTADGSIPGSVRVNYSESSKSYSVEANWGSIQKTFTLEAQITDWGNWAGKTYLEEADKIDASDAVVEIINAFIATINDAESKGNSFLEDGIGFNAKAYFAMGYGGEDNLSYAFAVKGNIGLTDEDTALALELLDGDDEVIYGLYFEGASTKEDCRIYLRAGDRVLYMSHANIVTILTGLFGGDAAVAAALEPILDLEEIDDSGMLYVVLSMFFMDGAVKDVDGDITTYQMRLDIEELIINIQGLLSVLEGIDEYLNELIREYLPAPINQLDIATVEGIAGQLLITVVTEDGLITDAEIALNMPKRDFRYSATDEEAKIYGPFNFVAGISGLNIGQQTDVVPEFVDPEYFSPLNFNFSGDVTILAVDKIEDSVIIDSVFSFELLTDINPFNLDVAKGSLIITELKAGETEAVNFVTIMFDLSTGMEYLIYRDSIFIEIDINELLDFVYANYNGDIEYFISDLILVLLDRFEEKPASAEEESNLDIFALLDIMSVVQEWYEILADDEKLVIYIDNDNIFNSVIDISLVTDDLNLLIDMLNWSGIMPDYIGSLDEPESIEIYYNVDGYENIFFAKIVIEGIDCIFQIDASNWETDKVCYVTLSIDELDYLIITIEYTESTDKEVKIVDAAIVHTVTITIELLDFDDGGEMLAMAIMPDYFTIQIVIDVTKNADGVLNGLQATIINVDIDEYYLVYIEGVAIWTYEKLWGIFDLDFTFDDIPHYGFGLDSNFLCIDVDFDNLYFNWGGANDTIVTIPEGEYVFENILDWFIKEVY